MGVVLGWNSGSVFVTNTLIDVSIAGAGFLGPRSGDSNGVGADRATQVGAPVYILVWGTITANTCPGFSIPAGWTQLGVYYSPVAPPGQPCFQVLRATYFAGMPNPLVGSSRDMSIAAISMAPYVFGTGTLEVGSDSFATPTVPGVAGLTQVGSVTALHAPVTTGIMIGRFSLQADFSDGAATPHFYGDPYMGGNNRGTLAGWNYADAVATPGFYIGPGSGTPAEFCAYAVAFSDSINPNGLTARLAEDATRVKPEYRPLTYESGGCITFV